LKNPSWKKYGGFQFLLTREMADWFANQYFPSHVNRLETRDYLLSNEFEGITSRVFILVAEWDILFDEDIDLIRKMTSAGCNVQSKIYPIVHAAFGFVGRVAFPNGYEEMHSDIFTFLSNKNIK